MERISTGEYKKNENTKEWTQIHHNAHRRTEKNEESFVIKREKVGKDARLVGQRIMEKALFKRGRSGHRYKWSAYRRIQKNAERFVITRD